MTKYFKGKGHKTPWEVQKTFFAKQIIMQQTSHIKYMHICG